MDRPNKVVVIGGGAAGMMAAYSASKYGADVTLIEKNEKTGKKIYITGKGRCNLTNDCDAEDFFKNIVSNPKFLIIPYALSMQSLQTHKSPGSFIICPALLSVL